MTKEKEEQSNSEETKKKKSTNKSQEKKSEVNSKKISEPKKIQKKDEKTETKVLKKSSTQTSSKKASNETKEVVAIVAEEKSKNIKKTPKKHTASIPKKKLPRLFKKKYSKRQFKKSLLSKIYIEEDKKYINSIFTEKKHPKKEKFFLSVDDDKLFTPVEVKHLKELAKQINKQKGTVKFIPLFIFIGIVASVFIFTDLVLKIGLKSTFQGIFKAKVDIGYVHLNYMDSSMTIKNLIVADKNAPMKNLFQFDSIVFDIDINRMLEKSIVIDEIEAAGFATGTERKTSGELIVKKKKDENNEPLIKPEFIEAAKTKITTELQKVFAKFDPQAILDSTYNSLQTPVVAKNVTEKVNEILPYWQNKPTEFGTEVNQFITKANNLSSIDFSNIKDIKTIENNINLISETLKEGENLKNSFNALYTKLDSDIKTVSQISSEIEKAIQADTKLAANITSSIKNFTPDSGMKIITDTVEEFLNGVLGNLYPTIKEVVATIDEIKEKLPEKEEKPKEEKPKVERLKGTNFYWNRPEMPKFYVGIAHASGSGFDFLANNISSNPKIIPKPMTLDGTYSIAQRQDTFNATIDLREDKTTPMFSASYHAPEIPTEFDFLKSNSTLDFALTMDDNKAISISGNAEISNADVRIPTFEPELAYNLCNEAITEIDETYLNVNAGFNESGNLNLKINTDFDNQFIKGVTALVNKELTNIKEEATKAISVKLEEYSAPVQEKISEFNSYKDKINSYKKELDKKLAELKAELEKGKQQLIDYGKQQTENVIEDTVNKYVDTEKLNSLKNLF